MNSSPHRPQNFKKYILQYLKALDEAEFHCEQMGFLQKVRGLCIRLGGPVGDQISGGNWGHCGMLGGVQLAKAWDKEATAQ